MIGRDGPGIGLWTTAHGPLSDGTLVRVTFHRWHPRCPRPRGLVRPVLLDPRGVDGPTRGQARGPGWRSTSYGLYVPSSVDSTRPEQRIMEQAARLPPGGAVTGWAALRLHGGNFFDGLETDGRTTLPVPLVVPLTSRIRSSAEATVSREPLGAEEVTMVCGIPCTTVRRATFDEMRRLQDPREAAVGMDMAAAALLVSISRMREYVAARTSWRRSTVVTEALDLSSEDSRSPNETRMRLIWHVEARFPRPQVNRSIWDLSGRLLGTADLLDEAAGLVGEFDGAEHRNAGRHSADVAREHRMRRAGLEVFRVTGPDLPHRDMVADRMAFHRSCALWLPPEKRAWTVTPPPGTEPVQSLDDYLEQEDFHLEMRERNDRELREEARMQALRQAGQPRGRQGRT